MTDEAGTVNVGPLATFTDLAAPGYRLEVWPYLCSQYRIMLIKGLDGFGYPNVVRQMCTYKRETCVDVCVKLAVADDPEAYCRTELEKPYNCEYPGGRIRLDNEPGATFAGAPE